MPKQVDEIKKYEGYETDEIKISKWLEENKGKAYSFIELWEKIEGSLPLTPDEKGTNLTWKNVGLLSINIVKNVSFHETLNKMVDDGKIKMIIDENRIEYYYY